MKDEGRVAVVVIIKVVAEGIWCSSRCEVAKIEGEMEGGPIIRVEEMWQESQQ